MAKYDKKAAGKPHRKAAGKSKAAQAVARDADDATHTAAAANANTSAEKKAVMTDSAVTDESAAPPTRDKSQAAFAKAKRLMPGGVSSPVRAYHAVGGTPVFLKSAAGPRVTDIDGNTYIDYVGSYGPAILGHAPDHVVAAVTKAASHGTTFGAPTEAENRLAEMVIEAVPSIEMVRFVNSGTEAAMSAIRLARAATGRPKVVKCTGCYHGHTDSLLVQAGSGATTLGLENTAPASGGVPPELVKHTLLAPYNDLQAAKKIFEDHPGEIAAFAVEPVAGNMGCVPPAEGYLQGLRDLCDQHGAALLFDEVMTGFRVAYGGGQARFGVTPDLTCLGKIVGGGLPCAAYGGREDLMRHVAPDGPMYQAGTLSGNPLAMAAGVATLESLQEPGAYQRLEATADRLAKGLTKAIEKHRVPAVVQHVGAMLCVFFAEDPVTDYAAAKACDTEAFARFFHAMLDRGVLLPPAQYEAWFPSLTHDDDVIDLTLAAADHALATL